MSVREYFPGDLQALREIHAAQGFSYPLPDLDNPLFVTRLVLAEREGSAGEEERSLRCGPQKARPSGRDDSVGGGRIVGGERIVGAALLRLTAEAYLLLDPRSGTPRERWERILALESAAEADAWRRGLADVHAWLPPEIARKFGRRLARRGWVRDDAWTPYCKRLGGASG